MVLYKRKPVQFLPPADVPNDDVEVWYIPETGEVFVSYEDYLNRMDFYKQHRFNDEITGQSAMTFFEALKSELTGGKEVEAAFPEALKGPVLRKVQFQTTSRLDSMVDHLFNDFKNDFYPGEEVVVESDTAASGQRLYGLVRDKTSFGARTLPDGTEVPPFSRYLVSIDNGKDEIQVRDSDVARDRGIFTKAMLRSFIKRTTVREAWNGAPWLVKNEYADLYHIDTRIPPHLRYDTKREERKLLQAQKRASSGASGIPGTGSNGGQGHRNSSSANASINGLLSNGDSGPVRLPELKPAPKSHHKARPHSIITAASHAPKPKEPTPPPPTPPPPPPKYPIEDLDLAPAPENPARPPLRFLCRNPPAPHPSTNKKIELNGKKEDVKDENETEDEDKKDEEEVEQDWRSEQIDMDTVGLLLETWDTLNVYCEIFKLDSFTFDDFVEAMIVASEQLPVQLFDEVHCAILKVLVDSERDGGKVRITLPEMDDDESDDEDDDEGSDEEEEEEEPPKPAGRATRSSLAKLEAERLAAEAAAAQEEAEMETRHRADEVLADYSWTEHLRKRDFADGGWELIMVGLLHQLSKDPRREELCEDLLLQLVPPPVSSRSPAPTRDTVRSQYAQLDVNRRVRALQLICMLTMETKTVRGYMEECSETMTKYRKDKIELQRQRKQATEELRQLNEQRKTLMPEPTDTPTENGTKDVKAEGGDEDSKMVDPDETQTDAGAADSDDESEVNTKSRKNQRRRVQTEKQKRDEEREREREREKAAAQAAKQNPRSRELNKVLKEIAKKEEFIKQCEDEVAVIDNDLREADCPRTRVLGKDRFWNRYYWFERNGMPYAGLPTSSTASAGYANGCIWVQGPHELELEGYINLSSDLADEYRSRFDMTVAERKAVEEGRTGVSTAWQWGYISEPDDVDRLIRWLDTRGNRESKLRKELLAFHDQIVTNMTRRKEHLAAREAGKETGNDEGAASAAGKRASTRIRDKTPEAPDYHCLTWENTTALEELGHLHSEPPPPPRPRKQTKKREAANELDSKPAKTRRR